MQQPRLRFELDIPILLSALIIAVLLPHSLADNKQVTIYTKARYNADNTIGKHNRHLLNR